MFHTMTLILTLLLSGVVGGLALGFYDTALCRVYPDPHIFTFHRSKYNYHGGECDLMLIKTTLLGGSQLEMHIRPRVHPTPWGTVWSGAERVALQINNDTLEITPTAIFLNGVDVSAFPPVAIGGFYPFIANSDDWTVILSGFQQIRIQRQIVFGYTALSIEIEAHGSSFMGAVGLCGTWVAPVNTGMLGRAGTFPSYGEPATLINPFTPDWYYLVDDAAAVAFGEEWVVSPPDGDALLFISPIVTPCVYEYIVPGPKRQLRELAKSVAEAEADCAAVTKDFSLFDDCVFDVRATGRPEWADTKAYKDLRLVEKVLSATVPEPMCVAEGTGNLCETQGGTCVWHCTIDDENTDSCNSSLCKSAPGFPGTDEECACAIPPECLNNSDCPNNGLFCNKEICEGGVCVAQGNPCSEPTPNCNEDTDKCEAAVIVNVCPYTCPFTGFLSFLCIFTRCGFFGRLLGLCPCA